mgnify:FL=1
MKGFIKAHEEMRTNFYPKNVYTYTTETKAQVFQTIREKLASDQEVTGIVCYNDEVAQGLIQALADMGKRVPEDYSVVGNDDSFLSTAGSVKLTTLSHPKEELGAAAAEWIMLAVQQEVTGNKIFEPELIIRDSVKRI